MATVLNIRVTGDRTQATPYAQHNAEKSAKQGEDKTVRLIKHRIEGVYKKEPITTHIDVKI